MNLKKIEKKWQKKWEENNTFKVKESKKKKYYVLEMYPYPSGSGLHMGHAFNYTIGDILARYKRMQGFNVMYPMGYDSFGLPAENAAIKNNSHPKKFTEAAIKNYIKQQKQLGLSYDWDRKLETHNPEYYKWDQWIFLKMFEKGLAYKKESPVNWCPECNTVLANEQVVNGRCWRHESINVEVKNLNQWFLKITNYADELYDGLEKLTGWPELIKKLQKNWIGKSFGTEIKFNINKEYWPVFTTRPDTLFGVTFMVVSAQHPRLYDLVTPENRKKVDSFLKKITSVSEGEIDKLEKEGAFTGSYATHPLMKKKKIPVYVGNFVLADYGSGMIMGVPAHDQRDFEFAKKYKIPIIKVIESNWDSNKGKLLKEAYLGKGSLINSAGFNGLANEKAKIKITKELQLKKINNIGPIGKKKKNFRLRDWLISRQRFWGTPIPIIYCNGCGPIPVPNEDLPILLPNNLKLSGTKNPLREHKEFVETNCPKCKGYATRETDTMDTFVNSSWYYLRYCDPRNKDKIFEENKIKYWGPVDTYIGGKEHATMHLIYMRFYTKFLRDLGLIKFDEPAINLFNQGMLHATDGEKMSKSKGNIITPENVSKSYGIDTARLFLVSNSSPDKDLNWSEQGIDGSLKFIKKIIKKVSKIKVGKSSKKFQSKLHFSLKNINECIDNFKYNLAIIQLKELFDNFEEEINKKDLEDCIKLISPFCPHISEELWESIGKDGFISLAKWPKLDSKKINFEFDAEDNFINFLISDLRSLVNLVKFEPIKAKIFVSESWKYSFVKKLSREIKNNRNVGELIKKLIDNKHNKEISKLVPYYLKDESRIPKFVLNRSKEFKIIEENLNNLKKEFNIEVIVVDENNSKALPGKPSIFLE